MQSKFISNKITALLITSMILIATNALFYLAITSNEVSEGRKTRFSINEATEENVDQGNKVSDKNTRHIIIGSNVLNNKECKENLSEQALSLPNYKEQLNIGYRYFDSLIRNLLMYLDMNHLI